MEYEKTTLQKVAQPLLRIKGKKVTLIVTNEQRAKNDGNKC